MFDSKETRFDNLSDYQDQQAILAELAQEPVDMFSVEAMYEGAEWTHELLEEAEEAEEAEEVDMFSMEAMYEGNTNWTHELLVEKEEEVDMFSMDAMYNGNTNWKMEA